MRGLRRNGSSGGFTLLEVMIALAIISIALITLLGLANRSIAVHERLQRLTQATLLAQEKLSELEGAAAADSATDDEGVFEEPFENYTWEVSYSDTPLPSVKMISVSVIWGNGATAGEVVTLDSFIF